MKFSPCNIEIKTHTDTTLFLVLLQNHYPYWHAFIDDIRQEIIPVNDTFMALRLPAGEHHVSFEFHSKKITFAFWISFICWIFCLTIIIFSLLKTSEPEPKTYLRFVLLMFILFIFTILTINNRRRYHSVKKMIPALEDFAAVLGNDSVKIVLNIDNPSVYKPDLICRSLLIRLQQRNDLSVLQKNLMKMDTEYILFAQVNTPFIPETDWLISQYYQKEIIRKKFGTGYYVLRKKGTAESRSVSFSTKNDFEAAISGWSEKISCLDTVVRYSGRYSNKLDSVNIYSSSFTTRISDLPEPGRKFFRISLQAMNGPDADALMVYEVTGKDKTAVWCATHLNDMMVEELKHQDLLMNIC